MKEIVNLPAEYYIQMIKDNKPFTFSRFGDGEILCMFNPEYFINRSGRRIWETYCGDDLKKIFINNYNYYHSVLNGTFYTHGPHKGAEFVSFLNETHENIIIYNGEIWQDLSFGGRITEITESISSHNPVFIGGKHLENIKYMNGITDMELILIDDQDAYLNRQDIFNQILKKFDNGKRLFCFSASVVGKLLIDDLFPIIGDESFLIDFGSLFDPYCGKLSRSNMVTVGFEKFQPFTKMKLIK